MEPISSGRKPIKDIRGLKVNRLTVTDYLGPRKHGKHWWLCRCECGGSIELPTSRITGKVATTFSCGCLRKEKMAENRHDPTTHGLHKHPLYQVHQQMIQRCYNPEAQRWIYYGGKGITVCIDWLDDFLNFYQWATTSGYEPGLSIDRVDSNGHYEPTNCRWITVSENTRRAHSGKRRRTVQENI